MSVAIVERRVLVRGASVRVLRAGDAGPETVAYADAPGTVRRLLVDFLRGLRG